MVNGEDCQRRFSVKKPNLKVNRRILYSTMHSVFGSECTIGHRKQTSGLWCSSEESSSSTARLTSRLSEKEDKLFFLQPLVFVLAFLFVST